MFKLEIDNKIAIYLNHQQNLKQLYEKHTEADQKCYELKKELFYFSAKAELTNVEKEEFVLTKKRKRKALLNASNITPSNHELSQLINKFLEKLKQANILTTRTNGKSVELPRSWEQLTEFPQLNGANSTTKFQMVNAILQTYIIPPHCRFYNHNVKQISELLPSLDTYDLIVIDPPWRNKYIRRLKRVRQDLAYNMLYNNELAALPIAQLIHENTLVAIWCTNSRQHQEALENELLPNWNLKLLHVLKWLKLNTSGRPISDLNSDNKKQPYELLFIGVHQKCVDDFAKDLTKVEMIMSIPSIIHSHKPPLLTWLQDYLPDKPKCLEVFGRYLQPSFTTIGLEVLKLMDQRLYDEYDMQVLPNLLTK